jgi:hypothetical protein
MVKYGVLFEVRTEFLNIIQTCVGFKGINLNSVNQLIFVMVKCGVLFEVRTGFLSVISVGSWIQIVNNTGVYSNLTSHSARHFTLVVSLSGSMNSSDKLEAVIHHNTCLRALTRGIPFRRK